MASVMGKQPQSLEVLLRCGAAVDAVDKHGYTVYHHAVIFCAVVITVLKDYDKSDTINKSNNKGESPLYLACLKKLPEATQILIQAGADPAVNNLSLLPIHAAVSNGDIRSIEAITSVYPKHLDIRDSLGRTPLHHACSEEVVIKLAALGCNMNLKNLEEETPLLVMMREKRRTCILALLCHGADCNVQDGHGETVLHKAVKDDNPEMVRTYIVFCANPNIKNNENHSPRHLASSSKSKNSELILYLLHVSGAERCGSEIKGCTAGCVLEGSHNGIPDKTMSLLMRVDSVAMFDELLSAQGMSATVTNNSGSVLEMTEIPNNIGDRVLSLDGGGIRGLVLIQILMEIEAALGKPIQECFDWIGGTSTGGILALALARGFSLAYIKGLYVRMKDEVFKGNRPYSSQLFETMLKREFGEHSVMSDIKHPKVMITAVVADMYPAAMHIFRTYEQPFEEPHLDKEESRRFPYVSSPDDQLIWEAARSTGAAPTYFRAFGRFLDGGLISNNPTLDMMTEIHEYNMGLKLTGQGHLARPIGCVVSLGTGRPPIVTVKNLDVFRPEGILEAYRAVSGVFSLSRLLIDQASLSEGRVVDRARAWCSMINVPYFRFSPQLSEDIPLDCHDHAKLINMMWETHCYMVANRHRVHELANLLKPQTD
ncbi:hypothetical protein C0Q70_00704 [Pomacea canaliculata]|uniref:phospholipase A2 n=2 Tax=Pomacea canaliculata TaxID=400727 RepID=A0A2T7PXD5_POMCA|nr:hypothetical protein C0Q70_00704 [Pomacea canaliculata]